MACSGYHSPQFSEDLAWLPDWLQPYEQPNNGFHPESEENGSPAVGKKCQSVKESVCKENKTQFATSGFPKYASCNLFLSGDDDLQAGSISCLNAHFHLHLSSVSIAEVLSDQHNGIPQPLKHEMRISLAQETVSESPVINYGFATHKLCEEPSRRLDILAEMPKPKVSYEPNTNQLIGITQNHEQSCHGKLVGGSQESTTVEDLVELSIAASEAVVISEMVSSNLQFESFSDAAILEIALRVKQARSECIFETEQAIPIVTPDDVDRLSDLDEDSMANAFEDVGITIRQIGEASYGLFPRRKSFTSAHGSDTKQQQILKSDSSYTSNILAGDCGYKRRALLEQIIGEDTSKIGPQTCSVFDCTLRSSSLHLRSHPRLQTMVLDNLPLDYSTTCLKYQPQDHEQKLNVVDALPAIRMDSMENGCIQKHGKYSGLNNAVMRKSLKFFTMESSFISESMEAVDQHVSQSNQSVGLEIVSSSNTVLQASSLALHKVKEQNHESPLSQDHPRSLSLADSLCSVVPCSISIGVSVAHDSELSIDGVEKSNYPSDVLCSNYLDGNTSMKGNSMLQKVFLDNREFILSETRVKYPSAPIQKQINSLMPYSLVVDTQEKARSSSSCKQLPLHGMHGMTVNELFEKNHGCSSDKNDNGMPKKWLDSDSPHNEQILEENKNIVESLALWGTENDVTQPPLYQHKDACSPSIVNYMKHRYQEFKVNLSGENLERMKRPCTSDFWKCGLNDSTKKTSCWDEATNISYTPGKSKLRLFPADEKPRKKRVRFQEASYNKNLRFCCGPTLLYNSESGLEHKCNCFINGAIEKNGMILQGLDFLLTGFSNHKVKELEKLIRRYGGYVLPNIPSNFPYLRGNFVWSDCRKLPVVLSPKKVHTTKFLYGCAVNTFMLNDRWLLDTIQSGATLPPRKYMIRPITGTKGKSLLIGESFCLSNSKPIFHKVGMMLHGQAKFCAKFRKIVKHGGGHAFKSLQLLLMSLKSGTNTIGIILVNDEGGVSRHLKHCALENDIPTVPVSWIINSLLSGKLLPFKRENYTSLHRIKMPSFSLAKVDESLSQEI